MKKKKLARFMIVISVVVILVVGIELLRQFTWAGFATLVSLLISCGLFVAAYRKAATEEV